jgi:thioredoxin reductase
LFHEKQIAIIGGGPAALLAAFLDPQKFITIYEKKQNCWS